MFGASNALVGQNLPIQVRTQSPCVVISLSLDELSLLRETDPGAAIKLAEMMVDYLPPTVTQADGARGQTTVRRQEDKIRAAVNPGDVNKHHTNGSANPRRDTLNEAFLPRQKHGEDQRKTKWEAAKCLGEDESEQQITLLLTGDSTSTKMVMYGASPVGGSTNANPSKGMFKNSTELVLSISDGSTEPANKHRLLENFPITKEGSNVGMGPTERLNEIQRHELKHALKMVQEAWVSISMGSASIVSSQLLALQPHLGEAGSELFKALFVVSDMQEVCAASQSQRCTGDVFRE
jgi:hypothetical protein